jgi:glycine hydroxymethyltransferase
MLIDLRSKGVTGKQAEKALGNADITVNKNMVPFDTETPFVTSGIRIGTAAVTTRGLKEEDCLKVVDWVDKVVSDVENEDLHRQVKDEINRFMEPFPLYEEVAI